MNKLTRLSWLISGIILGYIPCSLFFLWISLDCKLPFLQSQPDNKVSLSKAIYNIFLFVAWGFFHSLFAQEAWNSFCINSLHLPKNAMRIVYFILNGFNTLVLLYLWKPSSIQLWSLPFLSEEQNLALSVFLFFVFMIPNIKHMRSLGMGDMLGVQQLLREDEIKRSFGTQKLVTTGFYGQVRHPIYTFTLMSFLITNSCSLDRALLITASIIYLFFGIPVEERKLISLFGNAYKEYQKRVPAVIPRFIMNFANTKGRSK